MDGPLFIFTVENFVEILGSGTCMILYDIEDILAGFRRKDGVLFATHYFTNSIVRQIRPIFILLVANG